MMLSLVVVPPILIYALRRTIVLDAPVAATIGIVLGATVLSTEMLGATTLLNTLSDRAELYDLNRSTSWLAMCIGPIVLFGLRRQVHWGWTAIAVATCLFALAISQGQSAQLACLAGSLAAAMVFWSRRLAVPIFASCVVTLFAAPLVLGLLPAVPDVSKEGLTGAAHVHHRLVIWSAYTGILDTVPWYGLGANADEILGMKWSAVSEAMQRGGYEPFVRSPHTLLLEWRVNFSFAGLALLAGIMVSAGVAFAELEPAQTAAFTYVSVAAFTAACTATEFFQGWWIATIIVGLTLAALVGKPALKPGYEPRTHAAVAGAENRA